MAFAHIEEPQETIRDPPPGHGVVGRRWLGIGRVPLAKVPTIPIARRNLVGRAAMRCGAAEIQHGPWFFKCTVNPEFTGKITCVFSDHG